MVAAGRWRLEAGGASWSCPALAVSAPPVGEWRSLDWQAQAQHLRTCNNNMAPNCIGAGAAPAMPSCMALNQDTMLRVNPSIAPWAKSRVTAFSGAIPETEQSPAASAGRSRPEARVSPAPPASADGCRVVRDDGIDTAATRRERPIPSWPSQGAASETRSQSQPRHPDGVRKAHGRHMEMLPGAV